MAPKTVELGDFTAFMTTFKLVSPCSLQLAAESVTNYCPPLSCSDSGGRFRSIQEEEEEEEEEEEHEVNQHAAALLGSRQGSHAEGLVLSQSSSALAATPHVQSVSPSGAATKRQIVQCMCSSALVLCTFTALLLLLPLVLPPLPPPPSELMLLPVAILLLLICAALSGPRPMASPLSAPLGSLPQSIPVLPLVHSLPLRSGVLL